MSKFTLVCPACKSTDIKEGGYTGHYYWCSNTSCHMSNIREDNHKMFLAEGNRILTIKVEELEDFKFRYQSVEK